MTFLRKTESSIEPGTLGVGLDVAERQLFEEALKEAERKYQDIFENASEGIFQTTPGGRFLTVNPAMAAILGFESPDELIKCRTNISLDHYVDPKKRTHFKRLIHEHGFVREFVHEAYRRDGSRIWLSENVRAVSDENGTVRYYEGSSTDITERRLAEIRSAAFAALAQKMSGARTQLCAARIIAETADDLFAWDALNLDLYDHVTDLVYPMMNVDTIGGQRIDVTPLISIAKPTARGRKVIDQGAQLIVRTEPFEFEEDAVPFGDLSRPSAALMIVPIRHLSKVIGLLSIQSYQARAFDNNDLRVSQALADHCGEALNRIRAEESLYESEERYRDLVENSREFMCTHDLNGFVLSANRAAAEVFGYDLKDLSGQLNMRDLLVPEVRDQFDDYLVRIRRDGVASGLTLVQTRSGEQRVLEYYNTLRTEGVATPIVRGMSRDITERKRAEEALRQSERDYRRLFDQAHDAIIVFAPETEIVLDVNNRACEIYGFSRSEFIGMSLETISKYPDVGKVRLTQTSEKGDCLNFETVQYRKDGTELFLEINASMVLYHGQSVVLSINRDITERKRAEAALRLSESFRKTIIESEPECVKVVASDCTLLEMNPAGLSMIGATAREQVLGHSVLDLVAPECREAYFEMHQRVLQGESVVGEFEVIALTGERLWMEAHAAPIRNEESEVIAQLAITRDITSRKRSDESLKLFRSLLDRSSDAIEVIDPTTMQFLDSNESAHECLGYTREELLALTVFDIDPNLTPSLVSQLDREIEKSGFATLESLHRRKDGSTFPVEVNVTIVRLERDYRLAVVRDITERKRSEADARRQNEILEKIVDHIPVMINFTGSDGRIKLVNQEWQRTLGWSLEEAQGEVDVFAESYPDPEYRRQVMEFMSAANGQWSDFKTLTRDQRLIDTTWARVLLSDGTTIGIGRDITERKQAERAVREAEQKYRELFENARDALYVHDINGRYTSVNRAAESLTGYSREEILGRDFVGFVARKHYSRVRRNLCKKLEEEGETTYEVEIITKDRRHIPVEVSSHLIHKDGKPVGVQGAVRDVTDRKQAQESLQSFSRRLLEAQEVERQRIARTLHDEIGQVLTAVKLNLQAAQVSPDPTDVAGRFAESLEVIDEALVRVRDLSTELRPPHLDDFGLGTALRWYVDTYSQRTGMAARFAEDIPELGKRLPQDIETACFRIAQEALTNVARHAAATSVSVKLKLRKDQLRLTITDNGLGFSVPTVTGRSTAETLGLRGMNERSQAVGGSVQIDSRQGKGTRVCALLPIPKRSK